ncbi:type II toxin-antitoxin system TacA family antitoxin [Mycobacterium lacus]|uniref:Uncharacterized protein n=1 Tax=Mycobacterium lacus TaxID=169765 RepID=A0A1X1XSX0_9MYCO|nr:DUF1778 domain-containing protein [Mycobacterium lacus]MCV7125158.1 DUF1778 domain-containing protein [Mycobacterium lacus]ORW01938.1 toxin-antitoxin system protein [Mycobacterium lacus]BBX94723.1 hypothetical protein MLAC_00170 [Mycobacterium lacus]BBX99495.1 hypothetical protein MLAC_47890 [Mycobacterium lacus]
MKIKDKRIELRVDQESAALFSRAAELVHEPVSEFVRRAATERAGQVLAREQVTVMPAAQFDALLSALDVADDAAVLAATARQPRKFTRR